MHWKGVQEDAKQTAKRGWGKDLWESLKGFGF